MATKPTGFKPVTGKSVTIKLQPAKPMPKLGKPAPKPAASAPKKPSYGIAPPVTPGKLARAPEADDVLMARRGSNIIRTTVRERPSPSKKAK